jgi:hypothetical protein
MLKGRSKRLSCFTADNIWNTPVDQLPLAANSVTYVATIGGASLKADFGSGLWNGGPIGIPFITVPAAHRSRAAAQARETGMRSRST